ncbi:hypothetical protein CTI12_AA283370 [Artemisia annua]|uniref:FAR1 domain-containing protein n=1 Tax=Artemisia annua TaxID=35608 RepID=A0A2U1NCC8_ARTAN|nr:hypothetical protein CTI12_AA283370 [Artemisia annua]
MCLIKRSLAQTLILSASGIKNSVEANQYIRDLTSHMTAYLNDVSGKKDIKSICQQPDVILGVTCLLERLRGASSASEPRTQKAIYEMGFSVMQPILKFLEVYKDEAAVVYLLLKVVVDWVEGQIIYLEPHETALVIDFCMHLLQLYSSHNIGKISVSVSSSLQSEANAEKYRDLRALLQLLQKLCTKDMVDVSSAAIDDQQTSISQVIYVGVHIVSPLITIDMLKYPKLCYDHFALLSHMLEVYPEMIPKLNHEAFSHISGTLDFGLHHQDEEIVGMCLRSLSALALYHYKERGGGRDGLGGAADALFPLILCDHDLYQRLGNELVERQPNSVLKTRMASALHSLTTSDDLSPSADRLNMRKFRKNLNRFLIDAGEKLWVPDIPVGQKPAYGMMYYTLEQAYEYYKDYAKRAGFEVRLGQQYKSKKNKDDNLDLKYFVCSKEGTNPAPKKVGPKSKQRKHSSKRTDCKAAFRVNRYPIPDFHTELQIEKEASELYTRSILFDVQTEIYASVISCMSVSVSDVDSGKKYVIQDTGEDEKLSRRNRIVKGKPLYDVFYEVKTFPRKYVLRRWSQDSLPPASVIQASGDTPDMILREIFRSVEYCVNRYANEPELLQKFRDHQVQLMAKADADVPIPKKTNKRDRIASILGVSQPEEIVVNIPKQVSTKGSRKRIKSSIERSMNPSGKHRKNCRFCKCSMNDHNQANALP